MTHGSRLQLRIRETFAAALALPDHEGICRQAHGYRFTLTVAVAANVGPERPWIIDVAELETIVRDEILSVLDGQDLRRFMAWPSLEGLLLWTLERLQPKLPGLDELAIEAPPRYRIAWSAAGDAR